MSKRGKHFTYGETKIKITADFSSETMHLRMELSAIFKDLEE